MLNAKYKFTRFYYIQNAKLQERFLLKKNSNILFNLDFFFSSAKGAPGICLLARRASTALVHNVEIQLLDDQL